MTLGRPHNLSGHLSVLFVSRNSWSPPPPDFVEMRKACLENIDVGKQMLARRAWNTCHLEGQAVGSSEHVEAENRMGIQEHPTNLTHFKSGETGTWPVTEKAGVGSSAFFPPRHLAI